MKVVPSILIFQSSNLVRMTAAENNIHIMPKNFKERRYWVKHSISRFIYHRLIIFPVNSRFWKHQRIPGICGTHENKMYIVGVGEEKQTGWKQHLSDTVIMMISTVRWDQLSNHLLHTGNIANADELIFSLVWGRRLFSSHNLWFNYMKSSQMNL